RGQLALGRCGRGQLLRHPRIHGPGGAAGHRGVRQRQRRLRHGARDERLDRVPHPRRRLADGGAAPRERPGRAVDRAVLRHRARVVNSHWGDVVEDNSFGTHEFMDLVELLGTEAYVNGNVGSGTVREMSDWIEYLTRADDSPMAALRRENGRDEPWTVPFFGIGNEAWGCGGNMCAEDYAALARQYATYVRDHGDNQVTRIAAGASDGDYAWTEALMRAIDGLEGRDGRPGPFQAISLHYYTMSGPWADKG